MYKRVSLRSEAPSVFVGISKYPDLSVGILSTKQDEHHDEPKYWSRENLSIDQVVVKRRSLLNTSILSNATSHKEKLVELTKEIAMARVTPELEFDVQPQNLNLLTPQGEAIPFGPRAKLFEAVPLSNIKVDAQIEKAVSDTDAKTTHTVRELYKKGISEYQLQRLLSVGNLGVAKSRKLVPTRWSITATDDMLSKELLKKLPEFDTAPHTAYTANYSGNHFLVLFFDAPYKFENVEVMPDKVTIKSDCELTYGRSSYVTETAGAYYAARLACLEHMHTRKQQASVVILRFITKDYHTPLGVWVIRETIRRALEGDSIEFGSKTLLSEYARAWSKKKFGVKYSEILKKSMVLQFLLSQKGLNEFFG